MNQNHNEWEKEMPQKFRSTMNVVRTSTVPSESMQRFLEAAGDVERTAASWRRSNKNLMLIAMAISLVVAIGAFAVLGDSQIRLLIISGAIAYLYSTLGFARVLYRGVRDYRNAGSVLLDCGKLNTGSFTMFFMSILMFGVIMLASFGIRDIQLVYVIVAIAILLPISLYFFAISRGHLQVRANGIWHYIAFLPWHKIESWGWSGVNQSTLLIQKQGRLSFLNRGILAVPPEMKEQFEDYLQQNCLKNKETEDRKR